MFEDINQNEFQFYKEQLQKDVKQYLEIDDQIIALNKAIRERRKTKNKLSNDILDVMKKIEVDNMNTKNGQLIYSVTKKKNPSIGLLNIGSEDNKGNEVVKKTFELLKESHLNFYGNVEGNDIFKGTTDVVVCDGFVGNVALKTTEGVIKMFGNFLTTEYKKNWFTKIIALISLSLLKAFKRRLDPRRYNGASFLGLNGIVIKSHGGADILAFKTAIITAIEEFENKVIEKIKKQIKIESNLLS